MKNTSKQNDFFVSDFTTDHFQTAFKKYFFELGITVENWDGLFQEMNAGKNTAILRIIGDDIVGFIQYVPINFTSWFFEETCGFIREFWVAKEYRNSGHGTELLELAENEFKKQNILTIILTTDTADNFYLKNGYKKCSACKAKNKDTVYMKML